MGLVSGIVLSFIAGMTAGTGTELPVFFVGWGGTIYFMLRETRTLSRVFSRGFLIGASEWLLMVVAGFVFSGRTVAETVSRGHQSDASAAGATIGGGLLAFMTTGVSVTLAVVCLIGYAVSNSMGREMKSEVATAGKRCPQCAEVVQLEAKKCRFCGNDLEMLPTSGNSLPG